MIKATLKAVKEGLRVLFLRITFANHLPDRLQSSIKTFHHKRGIAITSFNAIKPKLKLRIKKK